MTVPRSLYAWRPLSADGGVLWLKYWWGPASANALAFRTKRRGWAVVSPPKDAPGDAYDVLAASGPVEAIVSPNGYHYLGQSAWRGRFPDAISLAPQGALARLAAKLPAVPFSPLEQFADSLEPACFFVPDGMKTPDTLIAVPTAEGWLWWLGDQFSNNGRADQVWLFRLLSRVLANGPGFYCNPKPELVYVRDRATWAASISRALGDKGVARVICAHGDPVFDDAEGRTLASLRQVASAAKQSKSFCRCA